MNRITMMVHNMRFLLLNDPWKDQLEVTWSSDRVTVDYRPSRMKMPAAMARIARRTPRLPRAGIKAKRPYAIRKMASNSIPIFLVIFMAIFLSYTIE
jgi:hypothetical protein